MYKDIVIELVIGFLSVLMVLKLLGKIQLSQITPFDFITAMVMGNLVGNAIFEQSTGIKDIVFSVFVWGLIIYVIEFLTLKSTKLRYFLEGSPTILIEKGKISFKQLKKNNMDLNQLQQLMRQQGYFSIYEAEYVILESDGKISIAPKHEYSVPTANELEVPSKKVEISYGIIMDGKLQTQNLKEAGLSEEWLHTELKQKQIKRYNEVFYAEWQNSNGLTVTKYS
ncbi:YetF domain-containing protein [Bacillales bacterium AN1005]